MVHLVWIGGTGVLQSILSSLILKVYHAFAFKPITIIFGKFTNFWMLFQITCSFSIQSILNVRTEKKYVRTQSPARLEHGQFLSEISSCFFFLSVHRSPFLLKKVSIRNPERLISFFKGTLHPLFLQVLLKIFRMCSLVDPILKKCLTWRTDFSKKSPSASS